MKYSIITIPLAICLTGCAIDSQYTGRVAGTGVGVAAGAGVGAVIGESVTDSKSGAVVGALIGAGVGGLIGFLTGSYIDERRAKQQEISKQHNVAIEYETISKGGSNKNDKAIIAVDEQFKSGSAVLTKQSAQYYKEIAQTYKEQDKKILIVGHTDDTGSDKTNQILSQKRAKAVGDIFAKNGVDPKNIYYQGAGASNPRADNNTEEGRAKNRRVEIVELDSTDDVAIYAAQKTTNSQYYNKQKIPATKVASKTDTSKKADKVDKTTKQTTTKQVVLAENEIDFGGAKPKNSLLGLDTFGDIKTKETFSLISKASAAESEVLLSCLNDRYFEESPAVSLSDGKAARITEHKKGLYGSSWKSMVNKHYVGLANVSVLNDGNIDVNPSIFVYKNYIDSSNPKADFTAKAQAKTIQGSKGLLYRLYLQDAKSPIKCMDIVFDNKNVSKANGNLYYVNNGQILQKKFELNPIKSKENK